MKKALIKQLLQRVEKLIKRLILIPLEFHHQDIHGRLNQLEMQLEQNRLLLLALLQLNQEKE